MTKKTILAILALLVVLAVVGVGAAAAMNGPASGEGEHSEDADDPAEDAAESADVPITGAALDQASAAALDYLGGGRVTATEVGDEESYYEVEVTLDDGRQVDVQLDEDFTVVGLD
jgi:uncharacterized membrane protein YkoI